jgi:protein SCO1/2
MSQQTLQQPEAPLETPRLNRTSLFIAVFSVALVATGVIAFLIFSTLFPAANTDFVDLSNPDLIQGGITPITPPRTVADFTLPSHTGEPYTLSSSHGKVRILFFGYTHCPDVCPLTMMEMERVRNQLDTQSDQVEFIFASVDGERDTVEWLNQYLNTRGVQDFMVGLTGTEGELKRVGADYGLYFAKNTDSGSASGYLVDHTASTFLIDQEGKLIAIMRFGTKPDVITEAVQELLAVS